MVHEKSLSRPEDEGAAKQPRVDDPSPPVPGGAPSSFAGIPLSSTNAATSSAPVDTSGERTPVRPTRPRSPRPPMGNTTLGESPQTPLPKRARATGDEMDGLSMVAAIAEVTEFGEEPQPAWKTLATSDHAGSTWGMRRHGARMVHLQHLQEHGVCEELDLPQEIKPLSIRCVDKDDYSTAKARLTAWGCEQELTGQENFCSATPQPATLRILLVVAQSFGLAVAVGDCAQAFLQAPILEKCDVWVSRPSEAAVEQGRTWRLLKTSPGLKGDEGQEGGLPIGPECTRPVCAQRRAGARVDHASHGRLRDLGSSGQGEGVH